MFTFIEPSTNVVPSGARSLTTAFVAKLPVLLNVISYVISSPYVTKLPLSGSDDFSNVKFDLFTVVTVVFVFSPSTTAVFLNSFEYIPFSNSSTVTSKLTVVSDSAPTFTVIPLFKSPDV